LLVIHPIIQFSAVMLTLYVFYLGVQRFRSFHLHQKTLFRWKRHVLLGKIAMLARHFQMIGGDKETFQQLEPVFKTLAPEDGYLYCGAAGAGHFVKMVHNGIE